MLKQIFMLTAVTCFALAGCKGSNSGSTGAEDSADVVNIEEESFGFTVAAEEIIERFKSEMEASSETAVDAASIIEEIADSAEQSDMNISTEVSEEDVSDQSTDHYQPVNPDFIKFYQRPRIKASCVGERTQQYVRPKPIDISSRLKINNLREDYRIFNQKEEGLFGLSKINREDYKKYLMNGSYAVLVLRDMTNPSRSTMKVTKVNCRYMRVMVDNLADSKYKITARFFSNGRAYAFGQTEAFDKSTRAVKLVMFKYKKEYENNSTIVKIVYGGNGNNPGYNPNQTWGYTEDGMKQSCPKILNKALRPCNRGPNSIAPASTVNACKEVRGKLINCGCYGPWLCSKRPKKKNYDSNVMFDMQGNKISCETNNMAYECNEGPDSIPNLAARAACIRAGGKSTNCACRINLCTVNPTHTPVLGMPIPAQGLIYPGNSDEEPDTNSIDIME